MASWLGNVEVVAGDAIEVRGARTHNLKGVTCSFPHGQMTVVTGVSGSGKSSLAFDTVFAEGQRRYAETLSTYVRQFIAQMSRPPVDGLANMLPSIALRQGNGVSGSRTTVAGVTEVADHLQLLFARAGETSCVACGGRVRRTPVEVAREVLEEEADGERLVVLGVFRVDAEQGAADMLRLLASQGHRRLWYRNEVVDIDDPRTVGMLDDERMLVVLDRLRVDRSSARLLESLEAAYAFGEGVAEVILWDREEDGGRPVRRFDPRHGCESCGLLHPEPTPNLLSSQSPLGACRTCDGTGLGHGWSPELLVPDPRFSLESGALAPLRSPAFVKARGRMLTAMMRAGVPVDVPWEALEPRAHKLVFHGIGAWEGLYACLDAAYATRKTGLRILVSRFVGESPCRACDGSGLSPNALAVRLAERSIGDIQAMRVEEALAWVRSLEERLDAPRIAALRPLLDEVSQRLAFLVEVGTGYLTLRRQARTLSGGEMHRVLLATNVGRRLTDTCYVLDEPTAGLHAEDTARLMGVIEALRDGGNTIIVVEHDPDVMMRADKVMELGPGGGEAGGQILFEGTVHALLASETPSGRMLSSRAGARASRRPAREGWLEIHDACANNLRGVSARFQHGALNVVTGVSGSGKSTLVTAQLYPALASKLMMTTQRDTPTVRLEGDDALCGCVYISQNALNRSSRSSIVTMSGAFGRIRDLFASEPVALQTGLGSGAFSYNSPGGRCPHCEGLGIRRIEMHFMADVEITCEVCDGARYAPEVLAVRYRGATISDVLGMSVNHAIEHFSEDPVVARSLQPFADVGLGYVTLGQPTTQFSGGEAQRARLAAFLEQADQERGVQRRAAQTLLFVMDEPTVGLHMQDVKTLMRAIARLIEQGHTFILIEHNLDVVAEADHVVDLGPGAGPRGGELVVQGTPEEVAACEASVTGRHLAPLLGVLATGS